MSVALEFPARLREILSVRESPVIVIDKLRELKAGEVADCVGLARVLTRRLERNALSSHAHGIGEFPTLLKLEEGMPEVALRIKLRARRIWGDRRDSLQHPKPTTDWSEITRRLFP